MEDGLPRQASSQEEDNSSWSLVMQTLEMLKNSEVVRVKDSYFSFCEDQGSQT